MKINTTFSLRTFEADPFVSMNGHKRRLPIEVPEGLELPNWQMDDIVKLYDRDVSANWSEMGAYKTSSALWLIQQKMLTAGIEKPNILVITTKSGKGTYFQLAQQILPEYKLFNVDTRGISMIINGREVRIPGIEIIPKQFDMPCIVIAHYDIFSYCKKGKFKKDERNNPLRNPDNSIVMEEWTQGDYIIDRPWDTVVADEAHRLKNRETTWTVFIKRIKAPIKHVMTGSGIINRPDDVWSLLNFLDKRRFGSYWDFVETYLDIEEEWGYRVLKGVKPEMLDEFKGIVRKEFGVRRTLAEVMPHIKEPIFARRDVELSPTQRKMYNQIKQELQVLDENGVPLYAANVLALLSRLRQICVATPYVEKDYYDEVLDRRVQLVRLKEPSSKLDALMDVLDELEWDDDLKQPLVVFSNFRDPVTLAIKRFEKKGISYIHLKTEDNDQERYRKWAVEFPKMEHRVFISTLQLGGESINLTPARHVCFLDRSWSPKDNSQGIGRIRRPGQAGQPVVINIEARRTTDQKLEHINKVKQGWFNEIFSGE